MIIQNKTSIHCFWWDHREQTMEVWKGQLW